MGLLPAVMNALDLPEEEIQIRNYPLLLLHTSLLQGASACP